MLKVRLTEFELSDILGYVAELRNQGYKQGIDFDFAYFPEKYTEDGFLGIVQRRAVEFTFYNEHLGLIFQLGR